jgi:glycosyltransferase involved in cell wall biosynthesis
VSIITPSYNQAAYLAQTMQSVFAQDYPNIEYIVVDGGSTDHSPEIIRYYSDRLAWWVSEKDSGQAEAINKGLRRARGDILAWLNSDDLYLPGAISQAVGSLQASPELGLVYGDAITMDAGGRPLNRLILGDWGLKELINFRIICQPAVFFRRSILEQSGYLDLSYHYLLDHQLWIRMATLAPVQHVAGLWAAARHHPEAKNVSQAAAFGQEAMRILDWLRKDPAYTRLVQENEAHILAGAYRLHARYLLDGGQPAAALRSYLQALRYWPEFALQHSHRMTYAILSLMRAENLLDNLRKKAKIKQRNQLISELKNTYESSTNLQNQARKPFSWPGLNLELF